MEPNIWIVIGSGYGDEGKGVTVDALVRQHNIPTVVRFNGGAQAGHTVSGEFGRHVFHHFCSGSLAGAKSHLSRFFVTNPVLFWGERESLLKKKANTVLSIDPRSPVTTPFEMMINQSIELKRGSEKHGSCGVGFGETLEREEKGPSLVFGDLVSGLTDRKLDELLYWCRLRCDVLGIDFDDLPFSKPIWERFKFDCAQMLQVSSLREDESLACETQLVFEGAQGLGLDQELGHFPYVTRSFTGMPNVASLLKDSKCFSPNVVYATRCYATRHGAGPFENEKEDLSIDMVDKTNIPNPWQDTLRVAPLDFEHRRSLIEGDLRRVKWRCKPFVFVSCLDQMYNRSQHSTEAFSIAQKLDGTLLGYSAGPSFKDVTFI